MVAKVVGVRRNMDFTGTDGSQITGSKVFVVYDDEHVDGQAADSIFVRSTIDVSHVKPGNFYDFEYESNFKGRARLVGIAEVYDY